jgi:outer membrane receptor protein involved in Fe transport
MPIFNTSRYVGAAHVDFDIPGQRWMAQVGTTLQGAYTPFEEPGILRPGFALFTVAGALKLTRTTQLSVGVRNLLDTRYRELESGGQATPGEGRAFYVTMRYRTP